MVTKPTYECLERRIKIFEKIVLQIRQAEKRLRDAVQHWEITFDAISDPVCMLSAEGKILQCNRAMLTFLEKPAKEVLGKYCWELVHCTSEPIEGCPVVRMWDTRKRETSVLPIEDKWFEVVAHPLIDSQNNIIEVVHILSEITKRKLAEEALCESEQRYRTLANSITDIFFAMDNDLRYTFWNNASERFTGVLAKDALGKSVYDLFPNVKGTKAEMLYLEALKTQQPLSTVDEYQLEEGTRHFFEINAYPTNTGLSVFIKNITARKQKEIEKERLKTQLAQAQKMQGIATLAGGIAHQFNNALSAIMGRVEILELDLSDDEKINAGFRSIKDSVYRMASLTDQLLAYARGGKYQVKSISLTDFVRDSLFLLKHTLKPSVRVEMDLPPMISGIKADLTQMHMVISAILTNASEAIEDRGQIRISCKDMMLKEEIAENAPGLKPGSYVCLSIADNGIGMDEETRKRIFEPFFSTKFQGRGLGMAAVYGIIKNHGGWIAVDSELNKGTTVQIYFPAIKPDADKERPSKIQLKKSTGTILLIEDEDIVVEVIREMLEKLGYDVLTAGTAKEAVNIAKTFEGNIDLAILDINLPDMEAKVIYALLMKTRPNLKVILCSGCSYKEQVKVILETGAQDFIQKPFSIVTLSEKLIKALDQRS